MWPARKVDNLTAIYLDNIGSSSHNAISLTFFYVIRTGSGSHAASYPIGTGVLSPWVERLGHEAGH
jgi:hypothetical protein